MSDHEYILLMTMTDSKAIADRIATELIDRHLAACVCVDGPVDSTFRWQGAVERLIEWRCVIKTRAALLPSIESAISELHPYSVPEIVATPVVGGSRRYLDWIDEMTAAAR